MPTPPATPPFDAERLGDFLARRLGAAGKMRLEPIAGGQSNPTYFVTFDDRSLVLRKQPEGPILPSAHAIDREYRVLAALAGSAVPVPPVLLYHGERDIVGTPFYVMERIAGRVFAGADLAGATPAARGAMFRSVAETLARLHDVDWRAAGLEGFGRPGNYFQRQIGRWTRQWEGERFRDIPDLSRLATWLAANIPADDTTTLSHGDFRIGNLMFHPTEPRVVAVLDWELATIGHPLADLAFSALAWRSRPEEYGGLKGLDLAALGIPTEAAYLAHYYRSRRHPVAALQPFHTAFALFRFAVIFEGIAARARRGTAASANAADVGDLSLAFARLGAELLPG